MTRDNVMSTPIFDELLREMAQRTEPLAPSTPASEPAGPAAGGGSATSEPARQPGRRRHRAD